MTCNKTQSPWINFKRFDETDWISKIKIKRRTGAVRTEQLIGKPFRGVIKTESAVDMIVVQCLRYEQGENEQGTGGRSRG